MNEKIDEALVRFISMKSQDLSELEEDSMTIAEKIALKIIMEALSEGGQAMKLLVERIGGTPINKNISVIRDEKSASMISSLEELLGGSRKDAIKEISDSGSNGHHKTRNGSSNSKNDSLLPDIPDDVIEAHIEHSDSDNEDDNDEQA